ncbi:DUF202 domain-containing protein [Streptomyces sp. NPDC059850]|uniref:DUF202 domain-containing protein n=1 Tax=Streptomyces sp. NPDC059850 TaxID=3346970 RepID=UPI00364DE711
MYGRGVHHRPRVGGRHGVTGAAGPPSGLSSRAAPDPGLQPERTELAWRRTALSSAVGALLLVHEVLARPSVLIWAVSGCAICTAAAVLVARGLRRGERPPPPWVLASVGALAASTGVFATAWVLVG